MHLLKLRLNMISFMFQNVLFYAISDDIQSAKKKLLIKENENLDIVFPGDGDIGSPCRIIKFRDIVQILLVTKPIARLSVI